MTEKLFYNDQYLTEFSARVVGCARAAGGFEITLDRTAFYPEGGGQPGDTGTLGAVRVTDTRERNGDVIHLCEHALAPGEELVGRIDWARRFDFMQQHSGEHIVSGLIHERFGYENVGFHMGAETVTIDFSGPMSEESLCEIERCANEKVWENVPVEATYPDPEALKTIPYRSKKALFGQIRIVTVPGADICACCGTHVARTGEIGLIKLLSSQRFHEGVRVELLSGKRAYRYVRAALEQNRESAALLSAKPLETAASVKRVLGELENAKYRLVGFENAMIEERARSFAGKDAALLFETGLTPDGARKLADAVMDVCPGICAVFCGDDEAGYKYAVGQRGGDLRERVKRMNEALHGRGGGKPFFAQGSLSAKKAEIEAFFAQI